MLTLALKSRCSTQLTTGSKGRSASLRAPEPSVSRLMQNPVNELGDCLS